MLERNKIGEVFRNNLKHYMNENNITREELVDKANLTIESLDRYLHGKQIPSLRVALEISYVLGVGIDKLVDPRYLIK